MGSIVDKFVREIGALVADKGVTIEVTEAARKYLSEKGYEPQFGARPLGRVIERELKPRIGDEILFGELEHGGKAIVDLVDGKLEFKFEPKPVEEKAEKEAASEKSKSDGEAPTLN